MGKASVQRLHEGIHAQAAFHVKPRVTMDVRRLDPEFWERQRLLDRAMMHARVAIYLAVFSLVLGVLWRVYG